MKEKLKTGLFGLVTIVAPTLGGLGLIESHNEWQGVVKTLMLFIV